MNNTKTSLSLTNPILPYVYMGIHKITGQFYIGSRVANKVPAEEDLGYFYFTSSKTVKPIFKEFNWSIVAYFWNNGDCLRYEQQLIYDNWFSPLKLNRYVNLKCMDGKGEMFSNVGKQVSDKTRQKMSASMKGRPGWNKGRKLSEDTRKKMSAKRKKHPCIIDGIHYESKVAAAKALNTTVSGINYKLINSNKTKREKNNGKSKRNTIS